MMKPTVYTQKTIDRDRLVVVLTVFDMVIELTKCETFSFKSINN